MDIQLGRAAAVARQTKTFIAYRALIIGAMAGCVVAYVALLGLVGYIFGAVAFWMLVFLSGAVSGIVVLVGLFDHPLLALLKTGHVALFAEIHTEGAPPKGVSQTSWAKEQVLSYYGSAEAAGQMESRIRRILTPINRRVFDVDRVLTPSGVSGLPKGLTEWLVSRADRFVSAAILAHPFRTKNANVRDACRQALVQYAQCWQEVLRSAVLTTVVGWGFAAAATIIFMIPLALPASMVISASGKFVFFAIALALGIATKSVFFDPVGYSCVMAIFEETCGALAVDADCEANLEEVSEGFKELRREAENAMPSAPETDTPEPVDSQAAAPADNATPDAVEPASTSEE